MTELTVNRGIRYQVFESFGVSGAWWAQAVGGWADADEESGMPKRERIAQLLFDKKDGIGVSVYRYNLGSGSADSGRGRYSSEARRAHSFDAGEGKYDWSRDENAVWMMKAAVRYGADEVVFFVNSPIERLTKNHKGYLDKAGRTNLARNNYLPFARYCLDAAEHFIGEGVPVKYLSPVNEPVWVWTENQEGCHYRPWQVRDLMRVFADEMDRRPALKGLRLAGAENGDIRWFNKTYCRIMLGDKKIRSKVDAVDTHSYFYHVKQPIPKINDRLFFMRRYRRFVDRHYPGAAIKTSEWTHMKGGRDYGMESALEQAKIMMEDISVLNITSWQNWIALSEYDYCDGLIYMFEDGHEFKLTKRYFAFGNFSKFVEKGSVRIDVKTDDRDLMCVGFEKDGRTVLIVRNASDEAKTVRVGNGCGKLYVTDDGRDLEETDTDLSNVPISPRSVGTIIYEG